MLCDKGLSQQSALKKQFKWNYIANWKRGLNNLSFLHFRPTSLVNCGADITKELRIPHAVYPSVKWTRLLCGFDGSVRLNWSVLSTLSISVCFCLCKKKKNTWKKPTILLVLYQGSIHVHYVQHSLEISWHTVHSDVINQAPIWYEL